MTVTVFEVEIGGIARAIRSMDDLKQAIADVRREADKAEFGSAEAARANQTLNELTATQRRYSDSLKDTSGASKQAEDQSKRTTQQAKQEEGAYAQLNKQLRDAEAQYRDLVVQGKQNTEAGRALAQTIVNLKTQQQAAATSARELVKEKQAEDVTYRGLSTRLNILRNSYKDLVVQGKENTEQGRALRQEVVALDNQLKQIDASVGQYQRNVGNYISGWGDLGDQIGRIGVNLIASFGITSAAQLFNNAIRGAARVVRDFDKAQTELAALSGQSREEIRGLSEDAKRLGSETLFTATEVTKLQVELSKLGFEQSEIKAMTKDIIDFAVALDADANRAAAVAASTLNIFGLEASETGRVVSVLGVAANKTALSFNDLEGNIATFGPIARALGFSLEDSISLFGSLRDSGFDASTAATALRNILLNLGDANGKLAQRLGGSIRSFDELIPALIKLRSEGVDLNESLELTDKRSVAAFNQLLAGADSVDTLRGSITNANAEFKVMVDERLTSIDAKIRLLNSAWEGLVLSIEDGRGTLGEAFGFLIEGATALLKTIQALSEGQIKTASILRFVLTGSLKGIQDDIDAIKNADFIRQSQSEAAIRAAKRLAKIRAEGTEEEKKAADEFIKKEQAKADAGNETSKAIIEGYNALIKSTEATDESVAVDKNKSLTLADLKSKQKELSAQLEKQVPGTEQFIKIQKDLAVVTDQVTKATQSSSKAKKDASSVEREREQAVRKELSALREQLELLTLQTEIERPDFGLIDASKEVERAQQLAEERLKIAQFEYDSGLISLTKFEAEKLRIQNDAKKQSEAALKAASDRSIEIAKEELEGFVLANKSKIDAAKSISDDVINEEIDRIETIRDKEKAILDQRYPENLRNEQEYLNELHKINEKFNEGISNIETKRYEEQQRLRDEQLAREAFDFQTRIDTLEAQGVSEFVIRREQLENQYRLEIDEAEKLGADVNAVDQKYSALRIQIAEQEQLAKSRLYAQIFGDIADLFGENTFVAKTAAVAQATINTYLAATEALKLPLPPPIPQIQAGLAIAFGLKQVAKISGIKVAKGISISSDGSTTTLKPGVIGGKSHAEGGNKGKIFGVPVETERGEFFDYDETGAANVINKHSTSRFHRVLQNMKGINFSGKRSVLSSINSHRGAGIIFAQEGASIPRRPEGFIQQIGTGLTLSRETLAMIEQAVRRGSEEGSLRGTVTGVTESSREAIRRERFNEATTI